jgi:hypothetical protein
MVLTVLQGNYLIALKAFFLAVLPVILLAVWIALKPGAPEQQAMLFWMLAPQVCYPLLWMVGIFRKSFEADRYIAEFMVLGAVYGVLLPVFVLPVVRGEATVSDGASDALLGWSMLLLLVWVPLLIASLWSPLAVEDWEAGEHRQYPALNPPLAELWQIIGGVVLFAGVPMGLFLPVYLNEEHSENGEAAMVVVAVVANVVGFGSILAPRIALRIAVGGPRIGPNREFPEMIVKLVYGCCILPMAILLPVYHVAGMREKAKNTLLAFMLMVPPITICDIVRTAHARAPEGLASHMFVAVFAGLLPFGILLPVWLEVEPREAGESVLATFMFGSIAISLLPVAVLVWTVSPDLPFKPLDYFLRGRSSLKVDLLFALLAVLVPIGALVALFFKGGVNSTSELVILSFIGIGSVELVAIYGKSLRVRAIQAHATPGF